MGEKKITNSKWKKKNPINWTTLKLRTFFHHKTPLREGKGKGKDSHKMHIQ